MIHRADNLSARGAILNSLAIALVRRHMAQSRATTHRHLCGRWRLAHTRRCGWLHPVGTFPRPGVIQWAFALILLLVTSLSPAIAADTLSRASVEPTKNSTGSSSRSVAPLEFTGVNLAGGEFGPTKASVTRAYGKHYIYPSATDMDYFVRNGVNIIRFPFRWADLQPVLRQPLESAALERVKKVVSTANERGLVIILDPHDYARYGGKIIGSPEVPHAAFADFWSRLVTPFKNHPRVWFGLMNEPHDMPNNQWLTAANAVIGAIRNVGATNLILVPGNSWTGAHSWISSRNAQVMLKVVDPLDHYLIEVHQYLDKNSSGTKPEAVSRTIGSERLQEVTSWCRTHGHRAFLGEFGAANNETALQATDDMLRFMEQNRDVWAGFTWWAAGPWWGDYMFTLEPKNGQDRPQMRVLRPHFQSHSISPN